MLRETREPVGQGTDGTDAGSDDTCPVMYSRAVDEAAIELRALRRDEWGSFALGALAIALALVATQARPTFAIPLFLGGIVVAAGGVRAAWRHWDLLERLAAERDAHVIPEVRARASREATSERRQSYAAMIRANAPDARRDGGPRADAAREELDGLIADLLDDGLELDPASAVLCAQMLGDLDGPLLDPKCPPEELRSRTRQIRAGFTPRARADAPDARPNR